MSEGRRGQPWSATQVIPPMRGGAPWALTPAWVVGELSSQGMGGTQQCFCSCRRRRGHIPPLEVPLVWMPCPTEAPLCPGGGEPEEMLCGLSDQEVCLCPPHLETFPPDEITSPAGEQAPIVKGQSLRERASSGPSKIAVLRFMNPHGVAGPIPTTPSSSTALSSPPPTTLHDLVVTSRESAGPAEAQLVHPVHTRFLSASPS